MFGFLKITDTVYSLEIETSNNNDKIVKEHGMFAASHGIPTSKSK